MNEIKQLYERSEYSTQKTAADVLNMKPRTFGAYVRGERTPDYKTMDKIRRVLGDKGYSPQGPSATTDGPVRRYPVASEDEGSASEIVVDPRIIGFDGDLPDPDKATAHYVSGGMMGPWMRDRQYVIARDRSQIESAGRHVMRWGAGGEKIVVEAFRFGDESVQIREHAPNKTYKLHEVGREGDAVIYEREDGSQITIEVLGRVVIPEARGVQMTEEITNSLSEVLRGLR